MPERDILNIEQAAALLGVSVKTFHKVLHSEDVPARKIGREWKFSRQALIDWVGAGVSTCFYRESVDRGVITPQGAPQGNPTNQISSTEKTRRTAGWKIELD
ncbi:MAG: helix-turn-helix domain-containing protein [Planctomycetes bacterium]|nr:helix-turn-helix domain-containing protein [Planctomycetota bacterium]